MTLIIVESPTKARTFNRILKSSGKDNYYVFATMGHFRDLPVNKMAIDFEKSFKPDYHIILNKKKVVDAMKKLAEKNEEIILATDLDREGESISYHVAYVLGFIKEKWPEFKIKETKNLKRIVFHEITAKALEEALANPGELRINLVKAQQARRILDRVVGYELSPLLWKKMGKKWLSAGRVQTVALRLIVEREKEILKFKLEPYHQLYGLFDSNPEIKARLASFNYVPYEIKTVVKLFDGEYSYTKTSITDAIALEIQNALSDDSYTINDISETVVKKYPPPPFTTSLLQQEGFRKFGYSSKQTMRLAQDLYERGIITYHRTDSFQLSTNFVFRAKDYIEKVYGKEYALEKPRGFSNKSKSAQEAHEAIRPTSLDKNVAELFAEKKLTHNHKSLYQLILSRAVSTQMKEAEVKQLKLIIRSSKGYEFESNYQQILFAGFMKVLNPEYASKHESPLQFEKGSVLKLKSVLDDKLNTAPPPRYNEASLIKTLEEKGVGRPSTYAPIISLIQDKHYIEREGRYFVPSKLGEAISDYLSKAFPRLFDLGFTAGMEEGLDKIADGESDYITLLKTFYDPFKKELDIMRQDTSVINVQEKSEGICDKCGGNLILRFSKFGKFLGCNNYPKCKNIKPFLYFYKDKFCPKCKGRIVVKYSKNKKRFYGCENYPKCDFSSWTIANIAAMPSTASKT